MYIRKFESNRYVLSGYSILRCNSTDMFLESKKDVERFIDTYLRSDGVFVIRMITLQSGVIFGTELVGERKYLSLKTTFSRRFR